ncbi:type II toxin-antitoxin system RelE/ParE family toxin [Dryocola sp. LX212]
MTYRLLFEKRAQKEWKKLSPVIRDQFKKKLAERLHPPRVPGDKLHGRKDQYKIKLKSSGYRLVYIVQEDVVTVYVIGVGKRENDEIYKSTQ